ncbi:MAG: FAD:protein FMN transferase [Candidatus Coproplasma sp.]
MKLKALPIAVALICAVVPLTSCTKENEKDTNCYFYSAPSYNSYRSSGSKALNLSGYAMGTELNLIISDTQNFTDKSVYNRAVTLWQNVQNVITEANNSLSITVPTSPISKFNSSVAGSSVELNKTAYEVLCKAKELYEQTEGYFNPAVVQSSLLYGFNSGKVTPLTKLPDANEQNAYKELNSAFVDLALNELDGTYYAVKPQKTVTVGGQTQSLQVDLGGIGKGWCADQVSELMVEYGFEYGYFSFGSSTVSVGKYNGSSQEYTIQFINPRNVFSHYAQCRVKQKMLSTSGDYEQFYMLDGVRYCHIIDPTTGAPIQTGVSAVTVIGDSATDNDALTTALSAMGKEKAVEFINANLSDELVVMLVFTEGVGEIICNRPDEIEITNSQYVLANTVEDGKIVLN